MEKILYIVAAVLMIFWLVGITLYSAGGMIHLLLVLAAISFLVEFISDRKKIGVAKGRNEHIN
jgi:hypothetical protein